MTPAELREALTPLPSELVVVLAALAKDTAAPTARGNGRPAPPPGPILQGGRHTAALSVLGALIAHHPPDLARTLGEAWNLTQCRPPLGQAPDDDPEELAQIFDDLLAKEQQKEPVGEIVFGERPATPAGAPPATPANSAIYVIASAVRAEPVEYLSAGRFPFGKVTVIEGDPGLAKSMLTLLVAARGSRGKGPCPGDPDLPESIVSIVLSGEDDAADTIRPRLEAAGADLTRVYILQGMQVAGRKEFVSLPAHITLLHAMIKKTGARLLIIDPLNAFIDGTVDTHRDHDIRQALMPLHDLAATTGIAILVIRHLTKAGGRAINAGGGSVGIGGAARSVMLVDMDPQDESRRILASVKVNVAERPASLAYTVEGREIPYITEEGVAEGVIKTACIVWDGASSESAESLTASRMKRDRGEQVKSKTEQATEWLLVQLGDRKPTPRDRIIQLGASLGFTERTLERAAKGAGIQFKKGKFGAARHWYLPGPELVP